MTSVSFTVTVVVPDNPPRCPPMSLAWRTTRYSFRVSRSMSGTAVRRMPGGEGTGGGEGGGVSPRKKNHNSNGSHDDTVSLEVTVKAHNMHGFENKDRGQYGLEAAAVSKHIM